MKGLAEQIGDIDGVNIYGRVVGVRGLMVEVAGPIQKMADIMKKVAGTSLGTKNDEQTVQLTEQNNRIGQICK